MLSTKNYDLLAFDIRNFVWEKEKIFFDASCEVM
jgi:hypothetical protein